MIQCDACVHWCHMECDSKPCKLSDAILKRYGDSHKYVCPICRNGAPRKDPPDPSTEASKECRKRDRDRKVRQRLLVEALKRGDCCPVCKKGWLETDGDMIGCDSCDKWVHRQCDVTPKVLSTELLALYTKLNHPYQCPVCRQGAARDDPVVPSKSSKKKSRPFNLEKPSSAIGADAAILLGLASVGDVVFPPELSVSAITFADGNTVNNDPDCDSRVAMNGLDASQLSSNDHVPPAVDNAVFVGDA